MIKTLLKMTRLIALIGLLLPNTLFSQGAPAAPKARKPCDYIVETDTMWIGVRKDGSGFIGIIVDNKVSERRELPEKALPYEAFKNSILAGEETHTATKYTYIAPTQSKSCAMHARHMKDASGDLLRDHAIASLIAEKTEEANALVAQIREADRRADTNFASRQSQSKNEK